MTTGALSLGGNITSRYPASRSGPSIRHVRALPLTRRSELARSLGRGCGSLGLAIGGPRVPSAPVAPMLAADVLSDAGFTVLESTNAEEALRLFETRSDA